MSYKKDLATGPSTLPTSHRTVLEHRNIQRNQRKKMRYNAIPPTTVSIRSHRDKQALMLALIFQSTIKPLQTNKVTV